MARSHNHRAKSHGLHKHAATLQRLHGKNSRHIDKTQSKLIRLEVKVTLNLHFKCIELLETKIRKAEKLKATEASLWTEVTKPEKE